MRQDLLRPLTRRMEVLLLDDSREELRAEARLLREIMGPPEVKWSVFEDDGRLEDDYGEESFP